MIEVAEACQLMRQALEILDAHGVHHSAAILDSAIHALPGFAAPDPMFDELGASMQWIDRTKLS
jgi:hypothetical protein